MERRPISQRSSAWAATLAARLAGWGVTPNLISVGSVGFAIVGATAVLVAPDEALPWAFLLFAVCVQARLLCNLLDGMVAVEHGKGSPVGDLYNEVPDRVADVLFIAAFGYLTSVQPLGHMLGWSGAVFAVLGAYVRALGGQLTGSQDFSGILPKPRRMFLLTVASILCALAIWMGVPHGSIIILVLMLITLGTGITVGQRLTRLAARLRGQ